MPIPPTTPPAMAETFGLWDAAKGGPDEGNEVAPEVLNADVVDTKMGIALEKCRQNDLKYLNGHLVLDYYG
jgi:hypothetical protein